MVSWVSWFSFMIWFAGLVSGCWIVGLGFAGAAFWLFLVCWCGVYLGLGGFGVLFRLVRVWFSGLGWWVLFMVAVCWFGICR